jgi:hypothetical protein
MRKKTKPTPYINDNIRWNVLTKYHRHCYLCGKGRLGSRQGLIKLKDPSKGSYKKEEDLILVCKACAVYKKNKDLEVYREWLGKKRDALKQRRLMPSVIKVLSLYKLVIIPSIKIKFHFEKVKEKHKY